MNRAAPGLAAALLSMALSTTEANAQTGPLDARSAAIPRVDLDGHATYGLGNGSALGAQLHFMASWALWRTPRALGSIELGALAGYINEPIALQPWNEGTGTTGTTHRVPFSLTLGHSFRFGRDDRFSFGVHGYAGAVHWISSYRVRFSSRNIEGEGNAIATVPDLGVLLRFTYRPHPVLGFSLQLAAPFFGLSPETVVGLFTLGAGVTVRLR